MIYVKYYKQKTFYFEMIKYMLHKNQLLEAAKNNSYSVPVLKIIRKQNVYEKENVYFKGLWPQLHNICRAGFFRTGTFSEQLLPTACEYSMFLPLTKIKIHKIKVTENEKSV